MDYPAHASPTLVLVLSGPSGAGKSTIIDRFRTRHPDFVESVSATTRAPRRGEREGVDYFFLDDDEFVCRIEAGGFLEHAQVFGAHRYGTPRAFVDDQLAAGRSVIMDVDVQGAAQIRCNLAMAVQVFIAPPTLTELARRLRGRNTDDEAAVARRLDEAAVELARWRDYDYLILNDHLDRAVEDLEAVVRGERLRVRG